MASGLSLSSHGLYAPDGLDCPEDGHHAVEIQQVILAKHAGGGWVTCQKCLQTIELRATDQE